MLADCSRSRSRVSGRTVGPFRLRKTLGNEVWLGSALGEPFGQALDIYLCPQR